MRNATIGVIGGQLFFWYCATLGNVQTSRIVRRHARPKLALQLPLELEEALVKREGMFFYGFILTSCRVSAENRKSLYSITAAAVYHGLSQMGVRILSAFGFVQPVSSLERLKARNLLSYTGEVRYISLIFSLTPDFLPVASCCTEYASFGGTISTRRFTGIFGQKTRKGWRVATGQRKA